MKIAVLDGKQLNDLNWEKMETLGALERYDSTTPGDVISRAQGAEAVLVNKVKMTREIMDALPELRYIGVLATGYDNIDLAAAREKGIVVTNVPGYSTDSVAQLNMALLLELCHHAGKHSDGVIGERKWSRQPYYSYWDSPLIELAGKTMGIIGMGKIGQRTAQIARAFGMNILAYSRTKKDIDGIKWAALNELLEQSDVVVTCCPLNDGTRGMMNASAFGKMKKTAFYINTARGGVVADADLRRALDEGEIAGAAIDVMTTEPPAEDNPLLDAKNIIITPHIAWATKEARTRLLDIVYENISAWRAGRTQNTVI